MITCAVCGEPCAVDSAGSPILYPLPGRGSPPLCSEECRDELIEGDRIRRDDNWRLKS